MTKTYYQATISEARDPKVVYHEFKSMADTGRGTACNANVIYIKDKVFINGSHNWYCWVNTPDSKSGKALSNDESATVIYDYISPDGTKLINLYSNGDKIIAPMSEMTLLDTNTDYSTADNISITVGSGKYKLCFKNVLSWWCHMSDTVHHHHDISLGLHGSMTDVEMGQVLGSAKEETTVSIYVLDASTGEWLEGSFYEFYGIKEPTQN